MARKRKVYTILLIPHGAPPALRRTPIGLAALRATMNFQEEILAILGEGTEYGTEYRYVLEYWHALCRLFVASHVDNHGPR